MKITDGVPLAHYETRDTNILVSSIGDAFQLIDLKRFHIILVSPAIAANITCLPPYI